MSYYKSAEYYQSDEYKEFMFNVDMLKGSINRICVTDEPEECTKCYDHALKVLKRIYEYRCKVLTEISKNEQIG